MVSGGATLNARVGVRTDLASGVDDVAVVLLSLVLDALGEGSFNRGIVRLDEYVLYVLDHQRGLACAHTRVRRERAMTSKEAPTNRTGAKDSNLALLEEVAGHC